MRRRLDVAALAGIRFNAVIKQFYDRLVAAGQPKKTAIVAVQQLRQDVPRCAAATAGPAARLASSLQAL